MRVVGIVLLICGLALGGDAFAHGKTRHSSPDKLCYQGSIAYKLGGYCYTSCAPTAACELEMCITNGEWMDVGACKVRDCRRVC